MCAGLQAQQAAQTSLTLEEAIGLARRNNPDFLAQKNDAAVADWSVREAYGGLLPGASASTSFQYQASGKQRFGIFTGSDIGVGETPAYYLSDYSVGIQTNLSGASFVAPGRAKAARKATAAGIDAADFALVANVTRQYLSVLRAQDGVVLATAELERAEDNRKLAEARVKVGAATPIEQKQAEVEKGRAQVALLQADNLVKTERLRLMQQLGLDMNTDVQLTTQFTVADVPWSQEELVNIAMESHPNLVAARANERASNASVKMAKSAYLPSLSFNAGISGYTRQASNANSLITQAQQGLQSAKDNCELMNALTAGKSIPGYPQTCGTGVLTPEMRSAIISQNNVFPFNYTPSPFGASLQITLPIFSGFTRELQVEQAQATASDARYRTRSEELRLRADVATAYLNAKTARESVALEEGNKELAEDQLRLARERYRLGAASFLELQDAATIKARADRAYLNAVYSFHESMTALNTAVGRTLR
ncbi:MAG TPA: TolC family protein [Longimicrobiales bacterium]